MNEEILKANKNLNKKIDKLEKRLKDFWILKEKVELKNRQIEELLKRERPNYKIIEEIDGVFHNKCIKRVEDGGHILNIYI